MDSKNVIAAIALSSAVIVLYSLFFIPEQSNTKQNLAEKNKIEQNTDTPSLEKKETLIQRNLNLQIINHFFCSTYTRFNLTPRTSIV